MQKTATAPTRLREHLESRGITQRQLTRDTGLSFRAVHAATTGRVKSHPGTKILICRALGIEPEELWPE